jgi:hypothetical protein
MEEIKGATLAVTMEQTMEETQVVTPEEMVAITEVMVATIMADQAIKLTMEVKYWS